MTIDNAYHTLFSAALIVLSVLTLMCLFRAIRGPRIADRIVSINMICTLTMTMICVLSLMLGEGYLVDVALIYAMIGFLAVVVLCKVYMGVVLEKREKEKEKEKEKETEKEQEGEGGGMNAGSYAAGGEEEPHA